MRPHSASLARAVVLAALGIAAAFNLALALALIWRPDELRYGEAILYDHAARLLRGEALYQPLDGPPYTIANYPPLYYLVGAGLRLLTGPGFAQGRLVSLTAALVVSILVGVLVWRRTHSRWASVLSGLLFIALGIGGIVPWSAAYKSDLLAVAFVMGSITVLDSATSRRGVAAAAVLAAAALLTKQSLAGAAVFGTLWLLATRPRAVPLFAGLIAALTLGTVLIAEASTGAFLSNIVGSNLRPPFSPFLFEHNLRELAIFQAVPTLIVLLTLPYTSLPRNLLAMNWLGSLIPMLPLGIYGADANYWLHFAAASAALVGSALWQHRNSWLAVGAAALLTVQVLIAGVGVASWHLARPGFLIRPSTAQAAIAPLVERVSSTPGTVLSEPLDVLVLADRPITLEPTDYGIRERDGSWDPAPVVKMLCDGQVPLVILGYDLDDVGERWPAALTVAMQKTMTLEDTVRLGNRTRYVYVPDPNGGGC